MAKINLLFKSGFALRNGKSSTFHMLYLQGNGKISSTIRVRIWFKGLDSLKNPPILSPFGIVEMTCGQCPEDKTNPDKLKEFLSRNSPGASAEPHGVSKLKPRITVSVGDLGGVRKGRQASGCADR